MFHSVYENSGFSADRRSSDLGDGTNSNEDIYMNEDATKIQVKGKNITITKTINSVKNSSGFRWYRLAVVCLMMLVILLLVVIAILWFKLITQREQLMTTYNNMTAQRDQLETSYNNLTAVKEQLKTSYNILTAEKDRVAEERDQLQKKIDELQKILELSWRFFKSSIYYISTEKKSWSESRQDCTGRGADLVTITSREEQDIINAWRSGEHAWIGASDRDAEGEWKWVDGTALTNTFWQKGEPNNVKDEDCVVSESENWNDVSCDSKYIWICEKKFDI